MDIIQLPGFICDVSNIRMCIHHSDTIGVSFLFKDSKEWVEVHSDTVAEADKLYAVVREKMSQFLINKKQTATEPEEIYIKVRANNSYSIRRQNIYTDISGNQILASFNNGYTMNDVNTWLNNHPEYKLTSEL